MQGQLTPREFCELQTEEQILDSLRVDEATYKRMKHAPQEIVVDGRSIKNPEWLSYRTVHQCLKRITGSMIGKFVGLYQDARGSAEAHQESCIRSLIDQPFAGNICTQWGMRHEPDALAAFKDWCNDTFGDFACVEEYGIIVNRDQPWMAYSPDGEVIVMEDGQERHYLLEIKCPFSKRNVHATQEDPPLYGEREWPNGESGPIPPEYWAQMQLGFHIMGLQEGFFVVWAPSAFQVTRVRYDQEYVEQTLLPLARDRFFHVYIPRLRDYLASHDYVLPSTPPPPPPPASEWGGTSLVLPTPTGQPAPPEPSSSSSSSWGGTSLILPTPTILGKRPRGDDSPTQDEEVGDVGPETEIGPPSEESEACITHKFKTAGICFRQAVCTSLLRRGPPFNITLEAEPTNPKDSHAVKVLLNGEHIGYLPAHEDPSVRAWACREDVRVSEVDFGAFRRGHYAHLTVVGPP